MHNQSISVDRWASNQSISVDLRGIMSLQGVIIYLKPKKQLINQFKEVRMLSNSDKKIKTFYGNRNVLKKLKLIKFTKTIISHLKALYKLKAGQVLLW